MKVGGVAMKQSFWRRHGWLKWLAGGVLLLLVALGVAVAIAARRAEPFLRSLIVARLSEHFHARVELDSFHISLVDGVQAEGKGLRIWPPAQVEGVATPGGGRPARPLIALDDFRFHAPLRYERGEPIHISHVELRGLTIDVPPKPHFTHKAEAASPSPSRIRLQVESVAVTDAHLKLEPSNPQKTPLEFAIETLTVSRVNENGTMSFDARLRNPRPEGWITTQGSFGPWAVEDPGTTPVAGNYRLDKANLGVFRGIDGTLTSTGAYKGALREMAVNGQADVPDFALKHFGTRLPLQTTFRARVDGTNGNTWLDSVDAMLGHSRFSTQGEITRVVSPQASGREITLNVDIEQGQMADFLRLTSRNGQAFLSGTLRMKTLLDIPPGKDPVNKRLRLKGSFNLANVAFQSEKTRQYIAQLSLRGQGRPQDLKNSGDADVRSTMASSFTMAGGVISLPNLVYTVPGAEIDLKGAYAMDGGAIDFAGAAKMDATISQMVGGWKGALLKPADRFFKKEGAGTRMPIKVGGTREDPKFGVNF